MAEDKTEYHVTPRSLAAHPASQPGCDALQQSPLPFTGNFLCLRKPSQERIANRTHSGKWDFLAGLFR